MRTLLVVLGLVLAMPAAAVPRLTFPGGGSSVAPGLVETGTEDFRFTGTDVNHAKSILTRAVLRSRHTMSSTLVWDPGVNYFGYVFLRDIYMASSALPGYFDAATLGPVLDLFYATIGGDPVSPLQAAQHFIIAGAIPQYREGANNVGYLATFDTAAYMILTTGQVYRRGDTTVYATRKAAMKAMFEDAPRAASGLLWSNPALPSCGWGFESGANIDGELGMASALYAQAAKEMIFMAVAEGDTATAAVFRTHYNALVKGLRTLRRADGLYKPSSTHNLRHTMLSSLMVAEGLIEDPLEAEMTAMALKSGVLTGQFLSPRSAMRHLYLGEVFPNYGPLQTGQNGDYWHGQWVGWLAKALVVAGDQALADKVIQAAVDAVNAMHTAFGTAPCEHEDVAGTCMGSIYSTAAAGFLEVIGDQKDAGSYKLAVQPASYSDDFSVDSIANYATSGTWTVANGYIATTDAPTGFAVNTSFPVRADGTFLIDLYSQVLGSKRVSMLFRMSADGLDGIELQFSNMFLTVVERVAGVPTVIGTSTPTITSTTWFNVRVVAAGTTFTVYVDGVNAGSYTTSITAAGYVGVASIAIYADTTEVRADNLTVWEGNPVTPVTPRGFTVDSGSATGLLAEENTLGLTGDIVLRGPTGAQVDAQTLTAPVVVENVAAHNVVSDSTSTWSAYDAVGSLASRLTLGANATNGAYAGAAGDLKLFAGTKVLTLGTAGTLTFFDGATTHDLLAAPPPPAPGGNDTELQFNDGGVLGGAATLKWAKSSGQLLLGSGAWAIPFSGGAELVLLSANTTAYQWNGRAVIGGAGAGGVAFLLGQVYYPGPEAWLGAHNGDLTAWADIRINPDGPATTHIGAVNSSRGVGPMLSIYNGTNQIDIPPGVTLRPYGGIDLGASNIESGGAIKSAVFSPHLDDNPLVLKGYPHAGTGAVAVQLRSYWTQAPGDFIAGFYADDMSAAVALIDHLGNYSGNAATATSATTAAALAADPNDCAAGTKATGIDASGNLTCSSVAVGDINATGTPGATNYLRGDGSWQTISGAAHVIQDEGANLTPQPGLNFTGAGVTCVDDGGFSRTTCTIGGATGANAVQATVDFGALGSGGNIARVTVTAAWVTAGSVIVCGLDLTTGTADHPAGEEDPLLEMISVAPAARVVGVSFDIVAYAPESTWGTYVVNCTGV